MLNNLTRIATNNLAVVTGASSGIGAEIARTLDQAGFQIFLTGRSEARLTEVSKSLSNKNFIKACDLSMEESATELASAILETLKNKNLSLRALINNAGIYINESFTDSSTASLFNQFQVNFFAPFLLTKALAEPLEHNKATVVNISSTLGARPVPNTAAYSASKAAMDSWTKTLALEWAQLGVRVIAISPGIVDTPIHSFHSETSDPARQQADKLHPLGRMGQPKDIANAVHYMLSDEASWITGVVLPVDGGISLS